MDTDYSFKAKDVIQFVNGDKRGLLAQIAPIDGALRVLSRDMDGTPHIFDLKQTDDVRLIGVAAMGPRDPLSPTSVAPSAAPITPLEAEGLLEPLPADVKAVPMNLDFSPEEAKAQMRRTNPVAVRRARMAAANKKADATSHPYSVNVTNGLGESVAVTIQVRDGLKPELMAGAAISAACRQIKSIRPFSATDWTRIDPAVAVAKTET